LAQAALKAFERRHPSLLPTPFKRHALRKPQTCAMHSSLGSGVDAATGKGLGQQSPEYNFSTTNGQRAQQFSKTKLCKFELLGICAKGRACPFAHGGAEMKPLPDLRCTKLCVSLLQTGQCDTPDCTFAHSREELRTTGTFRKTKLCRFFTQTGHCTLGWKCSFAHSPDKVRPPDTTRHEASVEKGGGQGGRLPYKVPLDTVIEPPMATSELGWEPPLKGAAADWHVWGDIYAGGYQNDKAGMLAPGLNSPWPSALPGLSPFDKPAYVSLRSGLVVDRTEDAWQVKCAPVGSSARMEQDRSLFVLSA